MRDYLDTRPIKLRDSTPQAASQRPLLFALFLCILAGALLFSDQRGLLTPMRGVLEQWMGPAAQKLTALRDGVVGLWLDVDDLQHAQNRIEALESQVSQLQADLIALEQIRVENIQLRQQLDIESRQPWRLLGAEVVVRSPDAGRRVMTIACGSNDGVQVGMAVVGQTGTEPSALVGIVEEVGPHTSSVLLITDGGSRISARVLYQNTSALGLVQGQWQQGSRMRLEQLDRIAQLQPGKVVVSAGLSGELDLSLPLASVPAGIPIGTVERVLEDDGVTQFADLRPFVDPDQVRYVWVILNQSD